MASRLTCPRAFVPYTHDVPSCLTRLHVLRALAPYVPSLRVLRVLFVHLEIFYDGFLLQQKLSIFQEQLKALEIVLFLRGPKKKSLNILSRQIC